MLTRADFLHYLSSANPERKGKGAPSIIFNMAIGIFDAVKSGKLREAVIWAPVQGKGAAKGETLHPDSNRERYMRCERLDGHQQVLTLLMCHTDIVTGDVCRAHDKTFFGMKVETIAEKLGMDLRRVERILRDLHRLGFIESWKRAEHKGDRFFGKTSIRKLSVNNIAALIGKAQEWMDAVRNAYKERASKPKGAAQLAIEDLRRTARRTAEVRMVGQLLGRAFSRSGEPPPLPNPA